MEKSINENINSIRKEVNANSEKINDLTEILEKLEDVKNECPPDLLRLNANFLP